MSQAAQPETGRPAKVHRVVIDLHPVYEAALDRALRKFRLAHGVEPRPSDIGKQALAAFCERQGEPFPDLPRRGLRQLPASRYEKALRMLHTEHPSLGPAALARSVGCSITTVRRVLPDLPILARGLVQIELPNGGTHE